MANDTLNAMQLVLEDLQEALLHPDSELQRLYQVSEKWLKIATGILQRRPKNVANRIIFQTADPAEMLEQAMVNLDFDPKYCLAFSNPLVPPMNNVRCQWPCNVSTGECDVYSASGGLPVGTFGDGNIAVLPQYASYLFIPHDFADLRVTPFYHDLVDLRNYKEPIRLLVLLPDVFERISTTVQNLMDKYPDMVVAGCRAIGLSSNQRYGKLVSPIPSAQTIPVTGFVISGHSVKVASLTVDRYNLARIDIRHQFERLRDTGILSNSSPGRSFAFVFSTKTCLGVLNKFETDEACQFAEVFPGVPVLGMIGEESVGHFHLPQFSEQSESRNACSSYPTAGHHWPRREPGIKSRELRADSSVWVLVSVPNAGGGGSSCGGSR